MTGVGRPVILFADMEKRVFYCGNIVCAVRAVVPCIVWIYFYLLIWRKKNVLLWKYITCCMCRRAMYSLDLFLFADMERRVFYCWKYSACTGRRAMNSVDVFLFADMENRVFYCGNTVRAGRAVVPCIVWFYFYLLIWRNECFIVEI
jgi:hypothetical protein